MVVPEGFHVEVFASEPMIRQPVTACFDERGRAWVIEYLQYPHPAGLKPVKVDQYLRTEYDRFPEPPPRGPRGVDRIKILEDTDGDGKADKATVFVEGLNLASGLAVGHGGVFVGQAPYLLFYPDANKDDKPDGDPKVLLSGFGLQDAHATVNSMQWGPDGWLYGAQGSTVTARIRGIEFQQGIWRYHPRTDVFELFAEGGGNTWGLDFDRTGNAFGSSNGSYIAFHMVQGGYYCQGVRQARPPAQSEHVRLLPARRVPGQEGGRARHPGGHPLQRGRLPRRVPRRLHRRQPAVEHRLLAQARRARLDLRGEARRDPDRLPRHLVPPDRPAARARRLGLRRRLVRPARLAPRPARQLGQEQRPHLSGRPRRASKGPPLRPLQAHRVKSSSPCGRVPTTGSPPRRGGSWRNGATRASSPRSRRRSRPSATRSGPCATSGRCTSAEASTTRRPSACSTTRSPACGGGPSGSWATSTG